MQTTAVISPFAWDKLDVWTEMLNHGLASDNDLYTTPNSKELFLRQPDVEPEDNCFIADIAILMHRSRLIFFLSVRFVFMKVISETPNSTAFSINHSNLSCDFVGAIAMCNEYFLFF